MSQPESAQIAPYISRLEEIPFVDRARVALASAATEADGMLEIDTVEGNEYRFYLQVRRSHLSSAAPDALAAASRRHSEHPWVVFAPHVGRPLAERLRAQGTGFVDRAGNCHLALGREHIAEIVGRPPRTKDVSTREIGEGGYRVIFALLVDDDLVGASMRELAAKAGVGKSTVSNVLRRLEAEGFVTSAARSRHLRRRTDLLERWVAGYLDTLRARLWIGAYRTEDADPPALEARLQRTLETRWAFGGVAAAWRLTEYYRSLATVIHAEHFDETTARSLRALPAQDGPLRVLGVPGPLAFTGATEATVHPLLIYAELLASDDDRARNAALDIRERYLEGAR